MALIKNTNNTHTGEDAGKKETLSIVGENVS
jgi:hypothetical protein